jgi:hypothetical protein
MKILSKIFGPAEVTIGKGAPDADGWVTSLNRLYTFRMQDVESRVMLVGGTCWFMPTLPDNGLVQRAQYLTGYSVLPVNRPKATPAVNIQSLYNTALSVVNGGDIGAVSSPLRVALTQVLGNIAMMHASMIGDTVSNNHGTSTADICLRSMLALASASPYSMRGEGEIANVSFEPDYPFALAHEATKDWFPMAWDNVAAGAFPATTVQAMVCSLEDFIRVAAGYSTPTIAAYSPNNWGIEGPNGVAVVPVRQSYVDHSAGVAAWASAHMEYPPVWTQVQGDQVYTSTFNNIQANVHAYSQSGLTRVAGPYGHVLFVLVDSQNAAPASVTVGRGAAGVAVTAAANRLTSAGAVEVDISAAMADFWTANLLLKRDDDYTALQWWNDIAGNESDFFSAYATVCDVYALHSAQPRRRRATGELLFWQNGAVPFVDNGVGYAQPTTAQIQALSGLRTTASGSRGQFWISTANNVYIRGAQFTIGGHEPLIYVGIAARFYHMAQPLTGWDLNVGWNQLCAAWAYNNTRMAAGFDWTAQKLGLAERVHLSMGNQAQRGNAEGLWRWVKNQYRDAVRAMIPTPTYDPTWEYNNLVNADYQALVVNTQDSMVVSRVTPIWMALFSGIDILARDDFHTVAPLGYETRNINVGGIGALNYDVLSDYGVVSFLKDENKSQMIRNLLSTGGFTTALVDITSYILCDRGGGYSRFLSVPFTHPTAGLSFFAQYDDTAAVGDTGSIRELCLGVIPMLVDPEQGNRELRIGLTAARSITASRGRALPIMTTRDGLQLITGAPQTDADSFSLSSMNGGGQDGFRV